MSASDRYDMGEEVLKSFTRSKVRNKILLCLKDGAKSTGDLEKEMGIRNTTILHAIKEMTDSDLVTRAEKGYGLTNLGKLQAYMLDEMIDFVLSLEEHRDFWQSHDISGIPIELLKKIGMLAQSEVIKDEPESPLRSLEYFVEEMTKSGQIYGVSPIIAPGFSDAIATPVRRGAKVEIILTEQVLDTILKTHEVLLRDLLEFQNFKLYVIEEPVKVAFTVTESFLNLGLYRLDGSYDVGRDLVCTSGNAVEWGLSLFEQFRMRSTRVSKL
jgi:predicted transcriptional regulator